MAEFFYVGCQVDEIEMMDLLLRRYHSIDFMNNLTVEGLCKLILKAIEGEKKENYRREWLALLPRMVEVGKIIPFEEYYDRATGKSIDWRPTEEIIAEIDKAHEGMKHESG